MEEFDHDELEESFARFERAAAKGHKESIWILSVVKDVEKEKSAWKEALGKTEEPLGWYFAGRLSFDRERFDFYKKSAEGGCSWGQFEYGDYFEDGHFVEKDEKVYLEWLEKAANQNNPEAMDWLGIWFRYGGGDKEKAVSYYLAGAELGWKISMNSLAEMLRKGEGCVKDLWQAVIWSAQGEEGEVMRGVLTDTGFAFLRGMPEIVECDFDQLCYSLGWGLYWYRNEHFNSKQVFANKCLGHYCSCVELQLKSIFTFLWFWNRTTRGIKGPGQMIAKMVWETREENLVLTFEELELKDFLY
jgi:hypothetical protein